MPVTIQEIASILDLSHTTVSRVLNGRNDKFISEATRTRVWSTAQSLGYRPNRAARALVTGKTHQIALWMSSLRTGFHAQVVHAVEEQLRDSGFQVLIGVLPQNLTSDWTSMWHVDGCLVFEGAEVLRSLRGFAGIDGVPAVTMGGTNFEDGGFDCVGIDLETGAREVLDHLDALGCGRIAFVGESLEEGRMRAYREFIARTGRTFQTIVTPTQIRDDVRRAVRQSLSEGPTPDALFCFNDDVAIASYRALRDLGIDVPGRVLITGCDGIEDTEYLDVPITTLQLPLSEMCKSAWTMLQQRMSDPAAPLHQTVLRPKLVLRGSTIRPPASRNDKPGSFEEPSI